MKSPKINFNVLKILVFMLFAPMLNAETDINILPIDVTGSAINEQSYISGSNINKELY